MFQVLAQSPNESLYEDESKDPDKNCQKLPNNETSPNNSSNQTDQKLSSNSPNHTTEQEKQKNPSIESSPKHAIDPNQLNNESSTKHWNDPNNENCQAQPNVEHIQEQVINTSAQVTKDPDFYQFGIETLEHSNCRQMGQFYDLYVQFQSGF